MKHFQLALVSLAISFLALSVVVKLNPTSATDLAVTRAVQSIHSPTFDSLMKFLTLLGNYPMGLLLLIFAAVGLFFARLRKNTELLTISTVGAVIVSELFKVLVGRPRPDGTLINQIGLYSRPDSFPSGHVLFFIGFFGYLLYISYIDLKSGLLRSILVVTLGLLIFLIGISRIYLGAHWFSDVLGSYLIGTIWLLFIVHLHHRLKQSHK